MLYIVEEDAAQVAGVGHRRRSPLTQAVASVDARERFAAELTARPETAARLLGCILHGDGAAGRIVETEFYDQSDPASHTYRGSTPRNRPMYERAGTLYVYRSYGIHWCANVVVGQPERGSAVLVRALEPLAGVERMRTRRPKAKRLTDLCSGPGKLCAALGIEGVHSGLDLLDPHSPVRLEPRPPRGDGEIGCGVRIGISKAVDTPWRFALVANAHVSSPRMGGGGAIRGCRAS